MFIKPSATGFFKLRDHFSRPRTVCLPQPQRL